MAVLDELLIGLGFDYDPKDIEKFNKDITSAGAVVKKFAKIVIGSTVALVAFATATTAATDKQGKLSKQTGVAVGDIDALEFALKRAGGESSSMGANLSQLAIRMSEASRGMMSGAEPFGILGVSATDLNGKLKRTDEVFLEVADALQRFSKAEQIELADKLGLRDSILLLQEGSKGITALTNKAKRLGLTTKKDAKMAADFQDSLVDVSEIMSHISRLIDRHLLPLMQEVADKTIKWWEANKKTIEQDIPKYIDMLTRSFRFLSLAVAMFVGMKLLSALYALAKGFKLITLWSIAAQLSILLLPALIFSVIAAIALLANDAATFFKGGDSFIGRMIEKYPQWTSEIVIIASLFNTLADLTTRIFTGWGNIFDLFTSGEFVTNLLRNIEHIGNDIKSVFDKVWLYLKDAFTKNVINPITDKIEEIKKRFSIEGLIGMGEELINKNGLLGSISNFFSSDDNAPLVSNDVGATNNANQIKVDLGGITVDVKSGSDSPVATGEAIGKGILRELEPVLKQTSLDLNSAVNI